MSKSPIALFVVLSCAMVACSSPKPAPLPDVAVPTGPAKTSAPTAEAVASAAPSAEPPKPAPPTPDVKFTGGLATPESVLFDAAGDRYLVANIQGKPVDVDNNGFISELSPDGGIKTPKWIEGGQKKVTLNAPKGMSLVKGVLYVADLDTVRMFDAKSGAPKGEVKVEGATFLNDVAASDDGKVYVSDSGLKMEEGAFKPTGTDAVWVIEKGKARALAKSPELGRPNGLLVDGKSVWVVTFGSGELYKLDDKGQKSDVTKLPKGSLDGIQKLGDDLLISSWEASAVFRGKPGGTFTAVLSEVSAPADFALDTKRGRLVVPRFLGDAVEAYAIK